MKDYCNIRCNNILLVAGSVDLDRVHEFSWESSLKEARTKIPAVMSLLTALLPSDTKLTKRRWKGRKTHKR
jgi:hypothetical protein